MGAASLPDGPGRLAAIASTSPAWATEVTSRRDIRSPAVPLEGGGAASCGGAASSHEGTRLLASNVVGPPTLCGGIVRS